MHLMGLVGYEMYTHLQSLTNMHPAQRSPITNDVLQKLHPWRERRFCEPGTKVEGCLACELGRLYQDSLAMEALSVVAKSGRRGKAGIVQLVDEGWVGSWGNGSWGVSEVRADRRMVRGDSMNAEWRGGRSSRVKGEVEWREKRGFVLSHGTSRGERSGLSKRHSVRSRGASQAEKPAQSQRHSVRGEKAAYVAPPVRPDRPKGLTLSMLGQQEDRVKWTRTSKEDGRTIKRKPVPIPNDENKDRGRKTLSTATTIVGSPQNRRTSMRHSHQPAPPAASPPSSRATDNKPARAASDAHPVPPPTSVYSRTQGIRSAQPKNILHSQNTIKPQNPTTSDSREKEPRPRIHSTQQTRWSDFNRSNVPRPPSTSNKPAPSPSTSHRDNPTMQRPASAPRRTKTMHAIGQKIADGKYQWWDTACSDSEDEKVVVPSLSRRNLRDHNNNSNNNDNDNNDNNENNNEIENSEVSNSDYEGDEDEEEIRQRYLDEHEALLRMAQGMDRDGVPRTVDYLNTLPRRPMENTTVLPLGMGVDDRDESTVRRERGFRDRSSPWL